MGMLQAKTPKPYQGKTILVTGASSGIGAEFARYFAREGANLFLIARREEKLRALKQELVAEGAAGTVTLLRADLSDPGFTGRVLRDLKRDKISIDVLVNNAGAALQTSFLQHEAATWQEHIQVNVLAFMSLTRALIPQLVERQGKVLNIASMSAFQPVPFYGIYAAGKAFMLSLSESLAVELKSAGVTVTCICPGAVRTDFNANAGIEKEIGPGFIWLTPGQVVKKSVRAMQRGKKVMVPGWVNKLNVFGIRFLPRALVARLAGSIYKNL